MQNQHLTSRLGSSVVIALGLLPCEACFGPTHFEVASDGGTGEIVSVPFDASAESGDDASRVDASIGRPGGPVVVSGELAFGAVDCGGLAKPKDVTVRNSSDRTIAVTATMSQHASSPYAVSLSARTVLPGHTATIIVSPHPIPGTSAIPGSYTDTLTVTTDLPGDSPHLLTATESAQGAILAFDTASIPFGDVPVSTAQSAQFHLVNTGSLPAKVDLKLGPSSSDAFSVSPASGQTVSSNLTLTADATFSPTSVGPASATIVVEPDPSAVLCAPPPAPLSVIGIGENGGLSVSAQSLTFGPTSCGTTASAQTLKLTNIGNSALVWDLTLSGTSPSPYVVSPTTTGSLAAGASVTLTVTPGLIPAQSSVQQNFYADTITINTDVIGDQPHVITLSQTAKGAILAFNPGNLSFGDVPVSASGSQPFQVVNTGNGGATVKLVTSAPFGVTMMGQPASSETVAAGGVVDLTGTFSPGSSTATQSGTIALSVGASDVLCAPLPAGLTVSGTGTSGVVAFAPSALSFGNQSTGGLTACGTQAPPQQVTFSNAGNQSYSIQAALGLGAMSPYTFSVSPANGTVAANGGTAVITITPSAIPATSAVPGAYGDTLTVTTTVAGDTPHSIALSESAYGAILTAPPAMVSFPSTPVGGQSLFQVATTNNGNAPATIVWNGISSSAFSFQQSVLGPPGGVATTLNAYFAPTAAEAYMGTATMAVSAATVLCQPIPSPMVMLSGTGVDAPIVSVTPDPVDFNTVSCGSSGGTRTVTIKNSSASSITWTAALTAGTSFTVAPPMGMLAPGATGQIVVTSNAIAVSSSTSTAANAFGDTLTVTTNAPGDMPHAIPVQETASGAILAWGSSALNLPTGERGQPVAYTVVNSGNLAASVNVALSNAGPAMLTLNAPTSGSSATGAPFQGSVTEASLSPPSTNASLSVTVPEATVLCQPLPGPLPITAN
jgi:hypothetical protein